MQKRNGKKTVSRAIIIQTGGRITFINDDAVQLLGVKNRKQAVEKSILEFFHPDSISKIKSQIETIQSTGKSYEFSPHKVLRADGKSIDVEVAIDLQTNQDYSAVRLIARESGGQGLLFSSDKAVAMDLPGASQPMFYRKKDNQRFDLDEVLDSGPRKEPVSKDYIKQDDLIHALAEGAFAGLFVVIDNKFVYVNSRFAAICGYTSEELTDQMCFGELITGDGVDEIESMMGKRILSDDGFASCELQISGSDGIRREIDLKLRQYEYCGKTALMGTVQDITAQKRSKQKYSIILRVSKAANESEDLISYLARIRLILDDVFDISDFFVALYDQDSGQYAFPYHDTKFDDPDIILQNKMEHSLVDYVRRQGEPLLADKEMQERLSAEGQYMQGGSLAPIWMGVPLKSAGKILGVVSIQSESDKIRFTENELELLTLISDHIAIAVTKKRTEDALAISQNTLTTMISNLPCMTFCCRPDEFLTMEYVSDGALSLTGYEPRLFTANSRIAFASIIHPEDKQQIFDEINYISDENQKIQLEFRIVTADGLEKWVWMQANVVGYKNGRASLLEGFITDISDRKIAEDEFSKAYMLLISAIEQLPAGVIIAEAPDINIRIANSAVFEIKGECQPQLTEIQSTLHPSHWNIFFPDGSVCFPEELPLSKAIHFGETIRDMEMIVRRESGEERWISISASPIRNNQGDIVAGIAVFPDITNRKKMEEELRLAYEKLRNDKHKLKEKNIALRELLGQIDDEKKYIENQIQANIDKVVMPLLRNILEGPDSDVYQQVKVLSEHIEEITSPFVRSLQHQFSKLTPREVEICNLIRQGMTSKEIIAVLNTSIDTIHQQRKIIRRKLGLTNKNINLTTYLNSL